VKRPSRSQCTLQAKIARYKRNDKTHSPLPQPRPPLTKYLSASLQRLHNPLEHVLPPSVGLCALMAAEAPGYRVRIILTRFVVNLAHPSTSCRRVESVSLYLIIPFWQRFSSRVLSQWLAKAQLEEQDAQLVEQRCVARR
jgi:hypothetical protein